MRRPLSRTLALQGLQGAPGTLARRARAMPSLDLRFAETKSLTDWISGQNLMTFTRASSGTVVNAAGTLETVASNLPRLTHNPLTGESLGLLLEEQRTNLNTNSEAFDTYSITSATVSANQGAAPNGSITADEITSNGGGAFKNIFGTTASASFTASVYAKYVSGGGNFIFGFDVNPSSGRSNFNLQNGTIVSNEVNVTASSITAVGSGWYRCVVTATVTSTNAILVFYNTTSGAKWLCWGAQLEAGAPTSYIPTTTAAATRSADLADLISAAIANNIRAIYVEFRSPASGTRGVFSLNDNTANEQSAILTSGTDSALLVHDNGIEQANIIGGSIAAGARIRVACRINQDSFAISVNGGIARTDNTGTVPTVDRLMIGRTQAGDYLNASIARIVGWVEPLPDATLQAITR